MKQGSSRMSEMHFYVKHNVEIFHSWHKELDL